MGRVRLARLLALVGVLAAVYFAQNIFDHATQGEFSPGWPLTLLPGLITVTRWLPDDLLELAGWLTLLGLLLFGLLSPWWHGEQGRTYRRLRRGRKALRAWWWAAQSVTVVAVGVLVAAGAMLALMGESAWGLALWGGGLAVYGAAGWLANRVRPPVVYAENYVDVVRPWSSWPYLAVFVLLFGGLYGYRLHELPSRVDDLSAAVGLAAQEWVMTGMMPVWADVPARLPMPLLLVVGAVMAVARDGLIAVRVAGLLAATLTVTGVWLVGCELFRRIPLYGVYGEVLEDDGRWLALLAALVVGSSLPMLHWSRTPLILEPVAWGTLSLWALLRGMRRDRPLLLGVSALLLGWTVYYGMVGLLFVGVAMLLWLGGRLLEPGWLTGKQLSPEDKPAAFVVQRGVGWRGFGYWSLGLLGMALPLAAHWWAVPGALMAHWVWLLPAEVAAPVDLGWLARAELTLYGLNRLADATQTLPYAAPLVYGLLAPLLALAVGAVLLNVDSLVGWGILAWLATGLVGSVVAAPVLPSWVALAMLLPVIGLAVAFALDRLRVLVMLNVGTWSLQATVYLALGVIVAAGLVGWVTYYGGARRDADLASSVGRTLRTTGTRPLVLVNGRVEMSAVLEEPATRLLTNGASATLPFTVLDVGSWPPLPAGARVLIAPEDAELSAAVEAAYAGGQVWVMRDKDANPLLYGVDFPPDGVKGESAVDRRVDLGNGRGRAILP